MANPDILFRGIPRGPTRGYTAQVLARVQPKSVIVPCCGSFSLAEVARVAGVPGGAVTCGDISIYSTAIGHAIMNKDWRLEIGDDRADTQIGTLLAPHLTDPLSKAAAVLFGIRLLQYERRATKVHHRDRFRELVVNADDYIASLKSQLGDMAERLHGLHYHARDMWETLDLHKDDPGAVLLVNPPRYTGGYVRMFEGVEALFDWDEPTATQFIEADYARLMADLGERAPLTLMYYATPLEDPAPLWGEPWRSVFADRPGNRRLVSINWIVANRAPVGPQINRTAIDQGKRKYRLFVGDVADDMMLWGKRESADVGGYYKDLFIHKLPGSLADKYAVLLLNGELLAVLGLYVQNLRMGSARKGQKGVEAAANLTFAFTVPHDTYSRLHKLTLMSLVSKWFWDDIYRGEAFYDLVGAPPAVQTTMLTPYPENKTARGVLTMTKREKQSDGTFKLSYYADIVDRTREETLLLWQQKYSTHRK